MQTLDSLMQLEQADTESESRTALQALIDAGSWNLEGATGRAMMDALDSGLCILPSAWKDGVSRPLDETTLEQHRDLLRPVIRDAYGNIIPFREMVKPGSLGTIEYARRLRPDLWPQKAVKKRPSLKEPTL